MCGLKYWIRVVVIALIIQSGHLISTGPRNGTAEILWRLSQLAVQGRQNLHFKQPPSQFQLHPEKFSTYTGPIKPDSASRGQYGLLPNYPDPGFQGPNPDFHEPNPGFQGPNLGFQRPNPGFQRPYPHHGYPPGFPKPLPALPPGYHQYQQNLGFPPQSFMSALDSIAQNDDLGCVPRLLCELTSGPSSGQRQESLLPFNINMESLIGVLSAVSGPQSSSLLEFGKAALLGYTSKGNTRSCVYAYPRCPQDPDRLVEYLNNHNGGFFRFFNGVPPVRNPPNPQHPVFPLPVPQYPQRYPYPTQYPQIPQPYPYPYPQTFPHPHPQPHPQQYPHPYPEPLPHPYPQPNPHPIPQYPPQHLYYQPQYPQYPQRHPQDSNYYQHKKSVAEKRILTQPTEYLHKTSNPVVRFPNRVEDEMSNKVTPQQEPLVFPEQVNLNGYEQQVREQTGRRQKTVAFPAVDVRFQKPSNLNQVAMVFPDRTGTGELRLDVEELDANYNYDNLHFASEGPGKYSRKTKGNSFEINANFDDRQNLFRFPLTNQNV